MLGQGHVIDRTARRLGPARRDPADVVRTMRKVAPRAATMAGPSAGGRKPRSDPARCGVDELVLHSRTDTVLAGADGGT